MTVLFSGNFNEVNSLKDLWTNPDAHPVIGLVYGIPGLFLVVEIVSALNALQIARELDRKGITVQGVIIDRWEQDAGGEGCVITYVGYHFSYMDSMWVGKKIAESSPYNKLQIEDSVAIRFLPRNPSISRIQ